MRVLLWHCEHLESALTPVRCEVAKCSDTADIMLVIDEHVEGVLTKMHCNFGFGVHIRAAVQS